MLPYILVSILLIVAKTLSTTTINHTDDLKISGAIIINAKKLDWDKIEEPIRIYYSESVLLACSFFNMTNSTNELKIMKKRGVREDSVREMLGEQMLSSRKEEGLFSSSDDEDSYVEHYEHEYDDMIDESNDENDIEYEWTANGSFFIKGTFKLELSYESLLDIDTKSVQFKCIKRLHGHHRIHFTFPKLALGNFVANK